MEKYKIKNFFCKIGFFIVLIFCCLKIDTIYYKVRTTAKKIIKYNEYVKHGISIENENNPVLGDETSGSLFDPWVIKNEEMGGYTNVYIL